MSVVVVVKVSEGLVLASDSATSLIGEREDPQGNKQRGIVKVYNNARKLLQIGDFPIGLLTWGHGYIGMRTVESLVREWEHKNGWSSQDDYDDNHDEPISVEKCAKGIIEHLDKTIEAEKEGDVPNLGLIIAGYSKGEFFPETYRFIFSQDSELVNLRPDVDGKPNFGANWYGTTDPIIRFHHGRDDALIKLLSEKYEIAEEELRETIKPLEYKIPFAVMPLQDAIEYANFMIELVIGKYKYVIGPELSGGEVDIVAITKHEFNWISQKSLGLKGG